MQGLAVEILKTSKRKAGKGGEKRIKDDFSAHTEDS